MSDMAFTLDTSHLEMSPLNNVANANMSDMIVTLDTSHFERSPSNNLAPENIQLTSVTRDTSHSAIGPFGPLEQSPFGSNLKHASTALSSSALDENDVVIAHTICAAKLYNQLPYVYKEIAYTTSSPVCTTSSPVEIATQLHPRTKAVDCLRSILERQLAVRAEDSDDDDPDRTYAFPPPVDLDAYAEACRLPPAEETEDEREARFQRERFFGL